MKLHKGAFALSAAIVTGICYSSKVLLFSFARELSLKLSSNILQLRDSDILNQIVSIDLTKYLIGLTALVISSFILAWVFACIYNMIVDKMRAHVDTHVYMRHDSSDDRR